MSNKSEKTLTEESRFFEAVTGSALFRNDNGTGFRKNGSMFTYGLDPGSADQVGWKETIVTPDMIGKKIAIFQSIEIKTLTDKISYEQIVWYLNVKLSGGIARVYTEDRFLSHDEIMHLPIRKESPIVKAKYTKIISNLLNRINVSK